MYVIESTIIIGRDIEDVFAFVADSENDPKWAEPVAECVRVMGDHPDVGTQYTFSFPIGPFLGRGQMEIVVFDAPHSIEWDGENSINRWKARCAFDPEGEGKTRVLMKTNFSPKGIFRLLESLMRKPWQQAYDQQFQQLKNLLESQISPTLPYERPNPNPNV